MRLIFAFLALLIVVGAYQANHNACYWHGDLVAFGECLVE